jgi:hypothetical protein
VRKVIPIAKQVFELPNSELPNSMMCGSGQFKKAVTISPASQPNNMGKRP